MITDDEFEALFHEAGGDFAVPTRGPDEILAAAAPPVKRDGNVVRARFRPRELVLAGTGIAAVVALTVALLTSSGGSPAPLAASAPRHGVANTATASTSGTNDFAGPAILAPYSNKATSQAAKAEARDIIATGTLKLRLSRARLRGDVARLEALAASFGGYVSAADIVETGSRPGGTIVVKVPAGSFSAFITKAEKIARVRSLTTSDTDVTGKVVDLGAQLTALVDERSQLEVLLGRAGKISELLSVENEIENVQSQIQQIQGEQRTIATQVDYSALTVDLFVPKSPHVSSSPNGFGHAVHEAVSSFVNGVKALVAHLGDLLFGVLSFVVVALIVLGLWRRIWPWVRRRIA
ncbi:MAG: DUF4349 domain-containing protein [Acidimicrobiales bacterium]